MVTIGKIPRPCTRFFNPVRKAFTRRARDHFWTLVLAITISHGSTIDRLARLLRGPAATHRTHHGDPRGFLWRSDWDESWVLQQIALDTLRRVMRRGVKDKRCYFIIDDTQTLKRAKKMEGVGRLYHHATRTYGQGHTILKVCLYLNGVTIPWGSCLYLKKNDVPGLGVAFRKLTELAADAIDRAGLPKSLKVTVLFDAFYLCPTVARACARRGWHYLGGGKSNRNFTVRGMRKKLGGYGRNVLRREGHWRSIRGLKTSGRYRIARRVGRLTGLGEVNVIFSRRNNERKVLALVTDDQHASATGVVRDYLKRWSIEPLVKDEKQQLGPGDYRVKRYRAVVRHLHLVDCAYACLTRLALDEHHGAQGNKQTKQVLPLPPISQLKAKMHRVVWNQAVQEVVKASHEKPVIRRWEKLLANAA